MDLPQTLHGQLYLLAYDRTRHRFDGDDRIPLFDLALRAAMLTDLYLTGHLEDRDGRACRVQAGRHDDLVLDRALKGAAGQPTWAQFIAHSGASTLRAVRDQLELTGWITVQRRRVLGIVPSVRVVGIYDDEMVAGLADRVTAALRNAIDDRPADPRPLALGLIAAIARMPAASDFTEDRSLREEIRRMILASIEPIPGLQQAIVGRYAETIRNTSP